MSPPPSASCSLGYKPFLNLIQPQLQQLLESGAGEPVPAEAFQPSGQSAKHGSGTEALGGSAGGGAGCTTSRAEDCRGGVAAPLGLPPLEPAGAFPPAENGPPEEAEEQGEEEGAYDCTLS